MPSLQLLLQTHSQLVIVITLGPVNALISSGISQVSTESTSSSISLSLHLFTCLFLISSLSSMGSSMLPILGEKIFFTWSNLCWKEGSWFHSFSYLNLLLLTRFVALMLVLLLLTIMVCLGLAVLVVCAENLDEQEKQVEKRSSGSTAPGNPAQCIV